MSLKFEILFYSTILITISTSSQVFKLNDESFDLTDDSPIIVSALGRVAEIGELYDARTSQCLHFSIFESKLPNQTIISTSNGGTKLKYTLENTFEEKFRSLDLSAEIKLSVLFDLITLMKGSGRYLQDVKTSSRSAKATLIQSITTEFDQISITDRDVTQLINEDVLQQIDATHVVIGTQWGGSVFVSVEDMNEREENSKSVEGNLEGKLKFIFDAITASAGAQVNISGNDTKEFNKFNFEVYGDILPNNTPGNLIDAIEFMKIVPTLLKDGNNGRGKLIEYHLISLNLLEKILKMDKNVSVFKTIDPVTIQNGVKLFDKLNMVKQKLNDFVSDVNEMDAYFLSYKVEKIKKLNQDFDVFHSEVKKNLSEILILVHSDNQTIETLQNAILESTNKTISWNSFLKNKYFDELSQTKSFVRLMKQLNVTMINKDIALSQFIWDKFDNDTYILFYSDEYPATFDNSLINFRYMVENSTGFGSNALFAAIKYELLTENSKNKKFYLSSNVTKISLYRKGKLIFDNYQNGSYIDNGTVPIPLWTYLQMQLKIENLISNAVPIGFIYIQLPNRDSPQNLWPNVVFSEVTASYAGLFFRALGDNSDEFEVVQGDLSPRLVHVQTIKNSTKNPEDIVINPGNWSDPLFLQYYPSDSQFEGRDHSTMKFYVTPGEVRPKNTAIRIWMRTQ